MKLTRTKTLEIKVSIIGVSIIGIVSFSLMVYVGIGGGREIYILLPAKVNEIRLSRCCLDASFLLIL